MPPSDPQRIRLLVVDDEDTQIELIRLNLTKINPEIEVTESRSPADALKKLKRGEYDCVVSDYSFPSMSGIQLCREIRKTSTVPFILYTARGSEEVAQDAFAAGVDAYIKKEAELAHYLVLANWIRQSVEKRRAERLLRENEQRLRFHIEHSLVGFIEWDADSVITIWSGAAEKIFGWSAAEVLGRKIEELELVYPEDRGAVDETLKRLTSGEAASIASSNRNVTKDGRVIHCSWYNSVLRDDEGAALSTLAMVFDNTQAVEMQDALKKTNLDLKHSKEQLQGYVNMLEERVAERTIEIKETKERLESFIESAPDAIFIYDPALRLLDLNAAALKLYPGKAKGDLVGKKMTEVAAGIEATERYRGFMRALDTGEEYHEESHRVLSQFGEGFATTWAFRMGKNLGVIRRDVTSRELDTRRHLTSEKLDCVTRMSQVVAHDLRGPLGAIIQAVNMTKQDPSVQQQMLCTIEENAVRSLTLVAGWRSNTRTVTPQPVEVNIAATVRKITDAIHMTENVTLETHVDDRLKTIKTDEEVLRHVLGNLIDNALEAMPAGGTLRVSVERGRKSVVIRVSDTGEGIAEDAKASVFTPLYSTKPTHMGLGLAYAKRAVEALGGKIAFESQAGKGTTFTVELPAP